MTSKDWRTEGLPDENSKIVFIRDGHIHSGTFKQRTPKGNWVVSFKKIHPCQCQPSVKTDWTITAASITRWRYN